MSRLISFALGLLALEVALSQELDLTTAHFMCPEVSSEEEQSCTNQCNTDAECGLDTVCCPSSCGGSCKTPIRVIIPKSGECPWSSPHSAPSDPCPENNECSRDNDCAGIMKCCNVNCALKCAVPVTEESLD